MKAYPISKILFYILCFSLAASLAMAQEQNKPKKIKNTPLPTNSTIPSRKSLIKQLPIEMQKLKGWEIKANPYFTKQHAEEGKELYKSQTFTISHFEVPLHLMRTYLDELSEQTRKALIHKKGNQQFFRWIIHPQDKTFAPQVAQLLKNYGFDSRTKKYFLAHKTSSRSFLLQDPKNPTGVFNMKVGTDLASGEYKLNKGIPKVMVERESLVTQHVRSQLQKSAKDLHSLAILPEAGLWSIKGIDQGAMVREIPKDNKYLLPGFAIFDKKLSTQMARKNGQTSPDKYWERHLVIPHAKALAEFFAINRMIPSSAHSQNFYLQLDDKMRPTGKIFFKDFGDTYFLGKEIKDPKLLNFYQHQEFFANFYDSILVPFRFFQSMEDKLPAWLTHEVAQTWIKTYYKTFEQRFFELTKIRLISSGFSYLDKSTYYYNWHYFQHPFAKQCFSANALWNVEKCEEFLECAQKFCEDKNIYAPINMELPKDPAVYATQEKKLKLCVRKGEKRCYQQLHLAPQCFPRLSLWDKIRALFSRH